MVTKKGVNYVPKQRAKPAGGGRLNSPKNAVFNGNVTNKYNAFNLQLFAEKEENKTAKSKRLHLVTSLILILILALSMLPVMLINKNTSAYNSSTTTYKLVGELWDSDSQTINTTNFIQMLKYLSSNGILGEVANSTVNAGTIRGYTYNGKTSSQSVVVTLGGMKWQVVYLTKDSRGKKIATLLLNDPTETSTWSSDWSNVREGSYPSNMYGTSYMRAVTLNNGGQYATSDSELADNYSPVETNKYATFTMDKYGLTKYLVQPKYVPYQTTSQGASYTGFYYRLNNEAIGVGGSYSGYDYSGKTNYNKWGDDYVWLPSLSELGYDTSHTGLWNLSVNERAISSSEDSWSRSAYYDNSYFAYLVDPSGSSSSYNNVGSSYAVRPALHLNLESAASCAAPQVSVSTSNSSQGTVANSGGYYGQYYKPGALATITATPKSGYLFDYWLVNDTKITANPYSFAVNEDTTCVAYFVNYGAVITSPNTTLNITLFHNENISATYIVTPETANLYLYNIQVGTNDAQILKSRSGLLDCSGNCAIIKYSVNENGKTLVLELFGMNGLTDIKLTYVNTSPNLPNAASGGGVNGAVVTATEGGEARIVGNDIANGADSDTVTYVAVAYKDYIFQGWVYADDLSKFISTNASMRLPKEQANGKVVTAVFVLASTIQGNINSETDNSTDFWE